MKKVKVVALAISFLIIFSCTIFAGTEKSKILKSFISEDASFNGIGMSPTDCVNIKNKKDSFVLEDRKITWSASIRGGLGSYNNKDYVVYWYSPDGNLYEKQIPKMLFLDCSGLKTSLSIDKDKMRPLIGPWKAEVTYEDVVIDNKYFYLIEIGAREIVQGDIDLLESKIKRDGNISKTREESHKKKAFILEEEAKIKNKELAQKVANDAVDSEKAKALLSSCFKTSNKDIEAVKDSDGITHIAYGAEKIYWRGQFQSFFGVTSPRVQIYWLTPKKEFFASNFTTFLPTNGAAFNIEGKDIAEDLIGEWLVIIYVNKAKIVEQKFALDREDNVQNLIAQKRLREERAIEEKRSEVLTGKSTPKEEIEELTKPLQEKHASITGKYVAEIRKKYPNAERKYPAIGDSEEYVIASRGRPRQILARKDGIEIWYYWEQNEWDKSRGMNYAVRGDFVGQFFNELGSQGTLTKIFIENGTVIEITSEQNVIQGHVR